MAAMTITPAFTSHVRTANASNNRLSTMMYMPVFFVTEAINMLTISRTSKRGDAREVPRVLQISQNMIEKKTKKGVAMVSLARLIARQGRNGKSAKKAAREKRIFQGTVNRAR